MNQHKFSKYIIDMENCNLNKYSEINTLNILNYKYEPIKIFLGDFDSNLNYGITSLFCFCGETIFQFKRSYE